MKPLTHKQIVQLEIERFQAIRLDKRKIIISHYFKEINLRKIGRQLTEAEKERIEIYKFKNITTEMLNLVEPGFEQTFDIEEALRLIENNSLTRFNLQRTWQRLTEEKGVHSIKYCVPCDQLTCSWCQSINNKPLKKRFKLLKNLSISCNCILFRASLNPIRVSHPELPDRLTGTMNMTCANAPARREQHKPALW